MNERRLFRSLVCVLALVGCGDSTPVTSECGDPIPEEELEDCFIETDGNFVNREDLDVLCETRCTRIENISLGGLEGVKDLRAFRNVREARSITIENTYDLETLDGLEGVQWRDQTLGFRINGNESLRSIEALNAPSNPRGVRVRSNPKLESLRGLENVVEGVEITTDNNDSLRNLEGLNSLERVELLSFMGNERLESGQGLDSVTTVSRSFNFIDNPNLVDVSTTLPSAESIQQVVLENSPKLRKCDVDAFVSRLEPMSTIISGNGSECP